ncbi:Thioesterase/thiol ester dehydrase-isomerase, partial [Aureobasidium melanogenum]
MAKRLSACWLRRLQHQTRRPFSTTLRPQTDGVFRALTENRIQTPWIEALREKERGGHDPSKPSGKPETPSNRDLTPKRMSDSYHSVVLPLAREPWLLDTYANSSGHIRLGTLFMDLDALSGVIAYKHTGDGVTTVTAACDRIDIKHPLTEIADLEYSGRVTYATGRSSMEISLQVAKAPKQGETVKPEDVLLTCQFTMVSLDPGTKKPVNIPAIAPETEEEKAIFAQGEKNSAHRKDLKKRS